MIGYYLLVAVLSYLVGSISTGVLISRHCFHDDVRTHGSGSAGMTNMLRNYSKWAAVVTFVCDFIKGVLPTLLAFLWLGRPGAEIAAFAAILGHVFPVFFQFHGGKGMVTAAGGILVLYPVLLPCLAVPWLLLTFTTRIVSVASIVATLLYPIGVVVWCSITATPLLQPMLLAIASAALLLFMHRGNIKRLRAGTENRFGKPKAKKEQES